MKGEGGIKVKQFSPSRSSFFKQRKGLLQGIILFTMLIASGQTASADVGIPPAHPGSSLTPKNIRTNVQMVSEEVDIIIQDDPYQAVVNAEFQMRNNSSQEEAIEVWFPLGERQMYGKELTIIQVEDFHARVNGIDQEIIIEDVDEWELVWAHWPVVFPANTGVDIEVSYTLSPAALPPPHWYSQFSYLLETGAGWSGRIERAVISVELPFPLDGLDRLLGNGSPVIIQPEGYFKNESQIYWVFTDFEPTSAENIDVRMLDPEIWRELLSYQEILESDPASWENHYQLAVNLNKWINAQKNALYYGLINSPGNLLAVQQTAGASFRKTIELDPPDATRYQSVLGFFRSNPALIESPELHNLFQEALGYFPEDQTLTLFYQQALEKGTIEAGLLAASLTPSAPPDTATPGPPAATPIPAPRRTVPLSGSIFLIAGLLSLGGAVFLLWYLTNHHLR